MIDLLHRFIIPAAYSVLPPAMASDRATAMLLAIGLQESRLRHRKQTGGPARSVLQFERIGVAGVLGHPRTREPITAAIEALCEQPTIEGCHAAITHNDVLAMCFGRCLLWQLPDTLPSPLEADRAWTQYLSAWRPGKPKPATWKAFYLQAWQVVSAARSTSRGAEMETDPQQVIAQLMADGYFTRVAQGDTKAASLWARLVADRLNPSRLTSEPGWLKKGGGHSVDGYAEDAICLNADPADLMNVVDLVAGAGAPGARPVWNGPLPRRASDTWEVPKTLSEADLAYLKGGSAPQPNPQPQPTGLPHRGEVMEAGRWLDSFYSSDEGLQRPDGLSIFGRPDWEGVGAWLFDVWLKARMSGKSEQDARAAVVGAISQTEEFKRKHRTS